MGKKERKEKKGRRKPGIDGETGGLKRVRCVPPSGNYQFKLPYRKEDAVSANHRGGGIHILP